MSDGHDVPAYGLWALVIINSAIFILFAFSFFRPTTKRDWRTFGSFSAFIVALFVEMYGFPPTIYLLSGWLARTSPGIDPLRHDVGHLWHTLLGFKGDPHWNPIHIASTVLIVAGFVLLSAAWRAPSTGRSGRARSPRPAPTRTCGTRSTSPSSSSCSAFSFGGRRSSRS
jgi:hypothetical protein